MLLRILTIVTGPMLLAACASSLELKNDTDASVRVDVQLPGWHGIGYPTKASHEFAIIEPKATKVFTHNGSGSKPMQSYSAAAVVSILQPQGGWHAASCSDLSQASRVLRLTQPPTGEITIDPAVVGWKVSEEASPQ
jgi:hypothetical protein